MRWPTLADIEHLAANLRACDRRELEASHGPDMLAAVQHAVAVSTHCWAMIVGGELALIGGAAPVSLLGGIGSPWMLGAEHLDRVPGALTRMGKEYRDICLAAYPHLVNYVDARNVKSLRWLRRIGFQIAAEPIPYGPFRMPFYQFEMRS